VNKPKSKSALKKATDGKVPLSQVESVKRPPSTPLLDSLLTLGRPSSQPLLSAQSLLKRCVANVRTVKSEQNFHRSYAMIAEDSESSSSYEDEAQQQELNARDRRISRTLKKSSRETAMKTTSRTLKRKSPFTDNSMFQEDSQSSDVGLRRRRNMTQGKHQVKNARKQVNAKASTRNVVERTKKAIRKPRNSQSKRGNKDVSILLKTPLPMSGIDVARNLTSFQRNVRKVMWRTRDDGTITSSSTNSSGGSSFEFMHSTVGVSVLEQTPMVTLT